MDGRARAKNVALSYTPDPATNIAFFIMVGSSFAIAFVINLVRKSSKKKSKFSFVNVIAIEPEITVLNNASRLMFVDITATGKNESKSFEEILIGTKFRNLYEHLWPQFIIRNTI